jgi:hypothetical protein
LIKNRLLDKIKIALYSGLAGVRFNIGGQLGGNEILALADSLSIKKWKGLYRDVPVMKKINLAYLVFLFAQIVSDIVNHSTPENYIRGWANIAMAIIVTNFLARILYKSPNLIIIYLMGEIIRLILFGQETEGVSLADMGFLKFRLLPILNGVVLVLAWYLLRRSRNNRTFAIVLFFLYGLFCIAFDARSNGIMWVLTGIVFLAIKKVGGITLKKLVPYLLVFVLVFQGMYVFYVSGVLAGDIGGAHSKEQFDRISNPYNPVNLLLAGRSETFVAMIAIRDKPVFGHGSWAPDKDGKYTYIMYQMHDEEDKFLSRLESSNGQLIIPSHSVLMGAWTSAGILGFVSLAYIFFLVIKIFAKLIKSKNLRNSSVLPILIYFFFNLIWTFLFSPLPHIKQILPIIISFGIVLGQKVTLIKPTKALITNIRIRSRTVLTWR